MTDVSGQRVVVAGGAGFLGSHLCDALLSGGATVVCVDNLSTSDGSNVAHLRAEAAFSFVEADITGGIEVSGQVDTVVHLASPASPVDYFRLPLETLAAGSKGTEACLELAARCGARYVVTSTSEVYGDPLVHPQREDYWGNVNSVGVRGCYDESKRFAEAIVMAYYRTHGANTRIVRIFNTYGPRMRLDDGRVLPNFIGQALRGEPLSVFGDGSQTRSFCYVDDLVEGIVRLLDADLHEPVNLGNPSEITILEFAREVLALTRSKSPIAYKPLPEDDPKVRQPDIGRARKLLGWEPKIDRHEGLKRTLAFFEAQLGRV